MPLRVAVEGCAHGELDAIYAALMRGPPVDLLICCGDFQAIRNADDLPSMAVPDKFKRMNSFYKYYSGEARAPVPTLFVGGNHEGSAYLWELFYGGYAAPNVLYMGAAGVVRFGGLRIAGLSGIWKEGDYEKGHGERPPYDRSEVRSAYHVRKYEVAKLMALAPAVPQGAPPACIAGMPPPIGQQQRPQQRSVSAPIDIFVSHDWPRGVTRHGNEAQLLKKKPYFRDEVRRNALGSAPSTALLAELRPRHWCAAHLHVKFQANVPHPTGETTHFVALDKCVPNSNRQFLHILEFPEANGPKTFEYDEEWLAITIEAHDSMPLNRGRSHGVPQRYTVSETSRQLARQALASRGSARIAPESFCQTAPPHGPAAAAAAAARGRRPQPAYRNPQTLALLQMLGLSYRLDETSQGGGGHVGHSNALPGHIQAFEGAILHGGAGAATAAGVGMGVGATAAAPWVIDAPRGPPLRPRMVLPAPAAPANPEEIDLDAELADENPEEIDLDAELAADNPEEIELVGDDPDGEIDSRDPEDCCGAVNGVGDDGVGAGAPGGGHAAVGTETTSSRRERLLALRAAAEATGPAAAPAVAPSTLLPSFDDDDGNASDDIVYQPSAKLPRL